MRSDKIKKVFSNKINREELKPGDHIYCWCAEAAYAYAHHGIYVGDKHVIHFTTDTGQQGISSSSSSYKNCCDCIDVRHKHQTKPHKRAPTGSVIISCLDCFLRGDNLHLFIYSASVGLLLADVRGCTRTMAQSDNPDLVLHRAFYLLKHGFGAYNLLTKNCEDFAIYCKTGLIAKNWSCGRQATSGIGLLSFAAGVLGVAFYGVYRYGFDISMRKDVSKVAVEELVLVLKLQQLIDLIEELLWYTEK